jgi:uncharacterized protein (TIRG00374 family)
MFYSVKPQIEDFVHIPLLCGILDQSRDIRMEEHGTGMGLKQQKRSRNRLLSWIINILGVLAFVLILYQGGTEAWTQIAQSDWRYLLAAFAVTLLWNLLAACRWSLITNQVAEQTVAPYRYFFTYHMLGMLMGQVVPITLGMLGGRPVALSLSRGFSLKRSALSVFLDKLFDLLLALLLVIPVALYLVDWISRPLAFSLIGGILVSGVLLVAWRYEQGIHFVGRSGARISKPLARLPLIGPRLVRRLPGQINRLATDTFLPNNLAVRAFLLTIVMYSLLGVRLFFIAQALNLDIPWHLMVMGVSVAQLTLVFAITPGSLGFLEGGWWAVLALAGITQDQFYVFVIGRRAFVLVFTLIDTLLAFLWIRESPARLFRAVLVAARQPAPEATPAP